MTRSYDEATAARRARLSPVGQQQRAEFEKAYDIAMQVIELREAHGLTQAELASPVRHGPGRYQPHRTRLHKPDRPHPPTRSYPTYVWFKRAV